VTDPWQTLRDAGLPLGSPDPSRAIPSVDEMTVAVHASIATAPTGRARDALCAFVLAWWRQWPRTFTRAFGTTAPSVVAWADAAVTDPNRYVKLSRIAMAHLARVL
jgi:hypothetical protein